MKISKCLRRLLRISVTGVVFKNTINIVLDEFLYDKSIGISYNNAFDERVFFQKYLNENFKNTIYTFTRFSKIIEKELNKYKINFETKDGRSDSTFIYHIKIDENFLKILNNYVKKLKKISCKNCIYNYDYMLKGFCTHKFEKNLMIKNVV